MRQKPGPHETAEKHVKDIRRATRKQYSAEEKIRIVLEGLRQEMGALKEALAETVLENRLFKKARSGMAATRNEVSPIREA